MTSPEIDYESKVYIAIGKITVSSCILEDWMKAFIGVLVVPTDDTVGMIMTIDAPFRVLHKNLMSLYRYRETREEYISTLRKLLGQIDELNTQRNEFMHSVYNVGSGERVKGSANVSKGLRVEIKDIDLDHMDKLVKDFSVNTFRLLTVMHQYAQERKLLISDAFKPVYGIFDETTKTHTSTSL